MARLGQLLVFLYGMTHIMAYPDFRYADDVDVLQALEEVKVSHMLVY